MFEFHLSKLLKKKKIKFYHDIELQEIFLDKLAQKKEEELGVSEKKLEVPLSGKILKSFLFFVVFSISILISFSFYFQVIEHKKYLAKAQENKFSVKSLQASRGIIYDRNLISLVSNQPSFNLIVNKNEISDSKSERNKILNPIAEIIKQNSDDLAKKIENTKEQTILLVENLDQETLIMLEEKIREFAGFEIQKNSIRNYKDSRFFSNLVGYTGKINQEEIDKNPENYSKFDYVGRDGLEKYYQDILHKSSGKIKTERDAGGKVISKEIISLPESGKNLVLYLDFGLQKKIIEEMEKSFETVGAKSGAAVAIDPRNGGVLALVSLPGFDNNIFNKGTDQKIINELLQDKNYPLFNRAISGQFPIGSTIKPFEAIAALEEKIILPDKKIYDPGFIEIPHRYNPEIVYRFEGVKPHGWVDMEEALAVSSNIYFYTIGGGYKDQKGLGPSIIKKYLELFGLGKKTNIDLLNEAEGFIPSPQWKKEKKGENWWDGDTYNLSIGQSDLVLTPLQITAAYSAAPDEG